MVRFFERSRGGPAQQRTIPRRLSYALAMLSAVFVCTGTTGAQMPGMPDGARIGIMGPDGEMEFLPTPEEMQAQMAEQMAARGNNSPDFSAIAAYAQRRIDLLGMVSEIVYVDDGAPVGGDGTSWQTAHQSLQDALGEHYTDRLVEIRMAQGNYRADRFSGVNTMDREASFSPRYTDSGETPTGILRVTGGFAGLGAKDPDQRDTDLFPTIITGDLNGDDGPDYTNYDDNSLVLFNGFNSELHGLVMEHAIQAMVGGQGNITIDGCLVQHHAGTENRGAAYYGSSNTLIVKRCIFYRNRSGLFGGAVESRTPSTVIVSNRFLSNTAQQGGGFFHFVSSSIGLSVLQNNYFAGNVARGRNGSIGGAAAIYAIPISACNTVAYNESLDSEGGGFGRYGWFQADHHTVYDVYHMNTGHTGSGIHEQFPSLSLKYFSTFRPEPDHHIRGTFAQDWESSESNRPGSYASTLDTFRDNSGEEVLFINLAGPDGVIGTLDDDPRPRPDSPNIDRPVDLEGAEVAVFDFADLNENGIIDEPLPFDLVGNPRSINTPGIGDPDGGIDAGAIEYAGDPARFDYSKPISGRRVDPMDGCQGDEPIRLYVNASGPVAGDGSSWSSPLLELYEALDIARGRCGPVEIWLAAGTYLPDFSVPLWRASFRPESNVRILGGFAGLESSADERDPKSNSTVLSGDRFGNDKPHDLDSRRDNAYRVVVSTGPRGGGVIDGVTIEGGYARAQGYAGFDLFSEGCFLGVGPYSSGAGVTLLNGDLRLINCKVSRCASRFGTAFALWGLGSLHLQSVTITDDHIRDQPCSADDEVSQIFTQGIDSILAHPVLFNISEAILKATQDSVPFRGYLGGNIDVHIHRSDVDFATPPYEIGNDTLGSGRIEARSVVVESSVLRRLARVSSPNALVNNSTLLDRSNIRFDSVPRPPADLNLTLTNSIIVPAPLAVGELYPISEAVNCLYTGTNFQTRVNEIRILYGQFEDTFVDFFGSTVTFFVPDGDYRLLPGSPAINTGSNAFVTSEFDLDGNPRIIGSVVDRGAYEFTGTCSGDVNGDDAVDLNDLNAVLTAFGSSGFIGDANGDGTVDMGDLSIVLAAFGQECSR